MLLFASTLFILQLLLLLSADLSNSAQWLQLKISGGSVKSLQPTLYYLKHDLAYAQSFPDL